MGARASLAPTGTGVSSVDAVVVGSGPNGLAAALVLALAGRSVVVLEGADTPGGGCRTAELTLPGFRHDHCAAVHPVGAASPFLRDLNLRPDELEWVEPELPLAHPFDDGTAAVLDHSVDVTSAGLGRDGAAYQRLMSPLVRHVEALMDDVLRPVRVPRHPLILSRFGPHALRSVDGLARGLFQTDPPRALLAGIAAHTALPLHTRGTSAVGLLLAVCGHTRGWPVVRGGSQQLVNALVNRLRALGGEVRTGVTVRSLAEVPAANAVLLDVTPRQLLSICGDRLPGGYRRALSRFRPGPGVFKIDAALSGPIPWRVADCARAGTVHLGGTMGEIAAAEAAVAAGRHPERPFVIVTQASRFDGTRAPAGRHTAWMYCHVPAGSTEDMTDRVEAQVERFAPGYRDLVLARHVTSAADLERYNPNCVGGDISGGAQDLRQVLVRPVARWSPYSTPDRRLYLCSSSTPPGGGVHGMCGYHAARAALRRAF